ncbi:MAG TPA: hypothetical protein VK575_06285 [Gemmatimonadaceae bacterium]|nr:hypothetical protein [Gemmatimonadaceae bacterium]
MEVRSSASGGKYPVTNKKLPALVQGRLFTALDLDGAGSNDRGIDVGWC